MQRNHSIDAIRGALLLIMSINHFVWVTFGWANIQYYTLQPLGQVGAAEGFIFISGLMVGLIYSSNDDANNRKLFHRAKKLYLYHIAALIIVLIIAMIYAATIAPASRYFYQMFPWLMESKLPALTLSTTLIHKPAYFDILPMYVAFLLATPLILQQLRRGHITKVMLVSLALWLVSGKMDLAELLSPYFAKGTLSTGFFSWLAWQLLFVLGLCLGHLSRHNSIDWFKYKSVTWICLALALVLFALHRNVFAQYGIHQGTLSLYADKAHLGWLRLFNFFLLVYLFSYLIHLWPNIFAFKPLALLGKYSLHVFTFHYIVIFALAPVALGHLGFKPNFSACLVVVTILLFIPPLIKERKKQLNALSPTRSS